MTELKPFLELSAAHQLAIKLKADGVTYTRIVAALEAELGLIRTEEAIRNWFRPGGICEQGYRDWTDELGNAALAEATGLLKRATRKAAGVLIAAMDEPDPTVRIKAAVAVTDRFVGKKITIDTEPTEQPRMLPLVQDEVAKQLRIIEAGRTALKEEDDA